MRKLCRRRCPPRRPSASLAALNGGVQPSLAQLSGRMFFGVDDDDEEEGEEGDADDASSGVCGAARCCLVSVESDQCSCNSVPEHLTVVILTA